MGSLGICATQNIKSRAFLILSLFLVDSLFLSHKAAHMHTNTHPCCSRSGFPVNKGCRAVWLQSAGPQTLIRSAYCPLQMLLI